MDVDFSDVFTLAARQAVQALAVKAQAFSFDYRGPRVMVGGALHSLRRALHRDLCTAADCLEDGFVMLAADAELRFGECRIVVSSAGTGQLASASQVAAVVERAALTPLPPPPGTPAGTMLAAGICPTTGATLEFSLLPGEGVLLRASFVYRDFEVLPDQPPPFGAHELPRLWLVAGEDVASDSLLRRLQRLGWGTTRFDSCEDALAHVGEAALRHRLPALVVLFGFSEVDAAVLPEGIDRLREALPPSTSLVYTVVAGSTLLRDPQALGCCELRVYPPSPNELLAYTLAATGQAHRASGETKPAPLSFADRPLVLVVDDNPVNRFVARGLVESMGYEVAVASHGLEAIDQCRKLSPRAVLMDVDMPLLDGIGATRELRRLQRLGEVPPCAIVAATAGLPGLYAQRCMEAGMDGFLSKPLEPQLLRRELRRVATL